MHYKFSIVIFFTLLCCSNSFGQQYDYSENAAFIFNFVRYTEWPTQNNNIEIGIMGNTPVEEELRKLLAKKKNTSSTYSIKNVGPNEAKNCDVLIVSQSSNEVYKKINTALKALPILVITEKENQSRLGACISFYIDEENDFKTSYQLSLRNCKIRKLNIGKPIQINAALIR